jgi:hypothetical protein
LHPISQASRSRPLRQGSQIGRHTTARLDPSHPPFLSAHPRCYHSYPFLLSSPRSLARCPLHSLVSDRTPYGPFLSPHISSPHTRTALSCVRSAPPPSSIDAHEKSPSTTTDPSACRRSNAPAPRPAAHSPWGASRATRRSYRSSLAKAVSEPFHTSCAPLVEVGSDAGGGKGEESVGRPDCSMANEAATEP